MNYQEAMQFVRAAEALGCTPGLSRVTELLERLDNPQNKIPCIHIAGTNGKGSIAAMLASILQAAGYRTGLYTTPHLTSYRERISVNQNDISETDFCRAAEIVQEAAAAMEETPSEFERFTPMAFIHFLRKKCDIAIIETGMGGRLDATNVIAHSELDVIAHIAMDHTEYLGDSLEKIAAEKAGIIHAGSEVVMMKQTEAVEAVIRDRCISQEGAVLHVTAPEQLSVYDYSLEGFRFSYRGRKELFLPMAGSYQQSNVITVLDAADILISKGWEIPECAVRKGLEQVRWPARFEILQRHPLVLLDGAHNADGMRALTETLKTLLPDRKIIMVMGVLADKEYPEMLRMILPHAGTFIAAEPDQIRALPAAKLAEEANNALEDLLEINGKAGNQSESLRNHPGAGLEDRTVLCGGTIRESLQLACSLCPPDGVICIAGSLYQAGETRRFFQQNGELFT